MSTAAAIKPNKTSDFHAYQKQYYLEHRNRYLDYFKQYKEKNSDKLKEYSKKYYSELAKNKKPGKVTLNCKICEKDISKSNFSKHLNTKKHMDNTSHTVNETSPNTK